MRHYYHDEFSVEMWIRSVDYRRVTYGFEYTEVELDNKMIFSMRILVPRGYERPPFNTPPIIIKSALDSYSQSVARVRLLDQTTHLMNKWTESVYNSRFFDTMVHRLPVAESDVRKHLSNIDFNYNRNMYVGRRRRMARLKKEVR